MTIYSKLVKIGKNLKRKKKLSENSINKYEKELKDIEYIIMLIDEPLLRGHLLQSYNWCYQVYKEKALYKKK